jgi:hypothetical protein
MTSYSRTESRWPGIASRSGMAVAALLLVTGCDGFGQAMTSHTNIVATAEAKELRVEEAAAMLGANAQIPPDPEVVRALAELWVDYALLATAVADDSTLAAVDIEFFVEPVREQALISMLRDRVVQADTAFDDAELERRWETEGPGVEISARHILLQTPADASAAQRDSIARVAESLRERAVAGESFEELATQYSQDAGTATRGGDLGFFGRGRMVQPFEDAAFQLQPGEISQVVETPFGYHVIRVEERRQQELGEQREQFRQFLVQQSVETAEVAYLDSISEAANLTISSGGADVVREIASRPSRSLSGRQGERAIATYTGGEYTAAEFARFIRGQPAEVQTAFSSATDEQLLGGIEQLVQMKLLLNEVETQGVTMTAAEEEQLRADARMMIKELVDATGFTDAARAGATPAQLDEHVKMLVQGVVTGEQPFIPLGRLGLALREIYDYEISDGSFAQVVSQLEEIRAQQPAPPAPPAGTQPQLPGEVPVDPNQAPSTSTPPPAGTAVPPAEPPAAGQN